MKTGQSRLRAGVVAVASAVLVGGAIIGSGATEDDASIVTSGGGGGADPTSQPSAVADGEKAATKAKVGDTVKLGDWQILVSKVTDPLKPDNEFMTPKAGTRWLNVTATVFNKSSKPQTVSSLACFDVRDAEGQKFSPTITGSSSSQLDGEVPANGKLKGDVAFEVPSTVKSGLELHFKCDFLSSGSAVITLK